MKLLLDLGNTRLKWALHDDAEFLREGSLTVDDPPGPQLADMLGNTWAGVTQAWFASVARDERAAAIEAAVHEVTAAPVQRVETSAKACGVTCAYADPSRLGIDRWLAVIAAYRRSPQGALVIDCGSAITLDAVDAQGRHLGGQIAPGIAMMRRALYRDTGRISDEGDSEPGLFGRDTRAAVSSGTLYAAAGFVQHASDTVLPQLDAAASLFITGGDAEILQSRLQTGLHAKFEFQPRLVMEGLLAMAEEMACAP